MPFNVLILIAIFTLLSGCTAMQATNYSEHTLAVSDQVTLAGALKLEAAASLVRSHTLIVDLRGVAEDGRQQAQAHFLAAGADYRNLPVTGTAIDNKQIATLNALLQQHPRGPVVVYCASGNRAALLWAAYLITQGSTHSAALNQVAPIINSPAIQPAIEQFQP